MAEGEGLQKPKSKKGSRNMQHEAPFPVPIAEFTGKPADEKRWYYYTGTLRGECVIVDRFGDMHFLYRMGFFGKGSLSRSEAKFSKFGNTFDDRCKWNYVNQHSKRLTKDEKELKEEAFNTLHQERLRQHTLWNNEERKLSLDENKEDDPIMKRSKLDDPYKIHEFLQLTLEEAFFLMFGLGCLSVLDGKKVQLSITDVWNHCRHTKPRFIETYAVYHHFRSTGWVVRDGLIYGSDFLLYKDGMPFNHASYAVFAYLVNNEEIGTSRGSLPWTWPYLTCINRVAEHVAKEVLLCLIVKPSDLTEEDLSSPSCLSRFEVQEILLRRWIPEKHREAKKGCQVK